MTDFEVDVYLEVWFAEVVVFFHTFVDMQIKLIRRFSGFAFANVVVHPFPENVRFARFRYLTVAGNTPQIIDHTFALACDMALDGPFCSICYCEALTLLNEEPAQFAFVVTAFEQSVFFLFT